MPLPVHKLLWTNRPLEQSGLPDLYSRRMKRLTTPWGPQASQRETESREEAGPFVSSSSGHSSWGSRAAERTIQPPMEKSDSPKAHAPSWSDDTRFVLTTKHPETPFFSCHSIMDFPQPPCTRWIITCEKGTDPICQSRRGTRYSYSRSINIGPDNKA